MDPIAEGAPSPLADRSTEQRPSADALERAAELLAAGELVVLPTETVYGIAARADRAASLAALAAAKRRPQERAFTWHVATPAALESFPRMRALVQRLAARYWPGPLTLVLKGVPAGLELVAREGWTGIRCVAHRATAELLGRLDFPVVMTSANLHGETPFTDAGAIRRSELGAEVAMVVDGGPTRSAEASTVLRVGPGHFELLREGLHDLERLRAVAGLRIGFVCTGNTCRSPMAHGIATQRIAERLGVAPRRIGAFGFELSSMGVQASFGAPASAHAVEALGERGIDLSAHRSAPATLEAVQALELVYCLTRAHLEALSLALPPGRAEHLALLDPRGGDVPDPIGGSLEDYRRCARHIAECIDLRLESWV